MIGADHTLPKEVMFVNIMSAVGSIVIASCYVRYATIYGSDWGEEDDDCPSFFPTWMLVSGIISLGFSALAIAIAFLALAAAATQEGPVHNLLTFLLALVSMSFLIIIVPSACFILGWSIYGLVLLIQSNRSCGPKLYDLLVYAIIATCIWQCLVKSCVDVSPKSQRLGMQQPLTHTPPPAIIAQMDEQQNKV